jgi:hypothetical protein
MSKKQHKEGDAADIAERMSSEGKDFIVSDNGEIRDVQSDCVISYVDCKTKKSEVRSLKPGDTLTYGDWDGKKCVRKKYTCPKPK